MPQDYTPKQIVEMLEMEQEGHRIAAIVEAHWPTIKAALLAYGDTVTTDLSAVDAAGLRVRREIMSIMRMHDEQRHRGYIDSPGGLEHMGDVWRMLGRWRDDILAAESATTL